VERDWGPELSQHPVKTAIGENLLSEAIHDAKKTAQALYAVQLEDFRTRSETRTSYAVADYERGRITKAAGVPEEMERQWLTVTLEAGRLFLDPYRRIYGILWTLCGLRDSRAEAFSYNKRTMDRAMGPF
jgi:hypothetical protein